MDSEFAQPHAVKKCIVLCVTGLLCFINPNVQPDHWNAHQNVVRRPGLQKLFQMLFDRFHVGLWSKMPMKDLKPLLAFILPKGVLDRLSFVFGREYCERSDNFPYCYKLLRTLFSKRRSRDVCKPDQVLLVDVCPLSLRMTPDAACYMPWPFQGDITSASTIIPNVATDILPFIYPLHKFQSVTDYMKHSHRPGQIHYELAHALKYHKPHNSEYSNSRFG
jgi:hypothetical protein